MRLATLAAWATNSSWVHPEDFHPEPFYAEQSSQVNPWKWCYRLFQFLFSSPCPGLHPHQTPAPLPNPGLYPPPVSMSPGQPPPQQLLAPTYFSAPGVMNFGNPSYPYAPGALPPPPPPHLYPNTQVRWLAGEHFFLGKHPLSQTTMLYRKNVQEI